MIFNLAQLSSVLVLTLLNSSSDQDIPGALPYFSKIDFLCTTDELIVILDREMPSFLST